MEKIVVGLLILAGIFLLSLAGGALIGGFAEGGDGGPRIAVLPVHGFITRDPEIRGFNVDEGVSQLEERLESPDVKAVVLDINSPGGTVVATEMLMRAVNSSEKPVVAWIGGSGTSGGYFVASEADYVVSDPLSITGSIGVSSQVVSAERLIDKLGLKINTFSSGELKSIGSFHRNMTEEEREIMQSIVEEIHQELLSRLIEKRELNETQIGRIEKGQIMLAKEAFELGLVDELGGRKAAIERAAGLANVTDYSVERAEKEEGLGDLLKELSRLSAESFGEGFARAWMGQGVESKAF